MTDNDWQPEDMTVWSKIWNLNSGVELHTMRGHADRVTSIVFTPDSSRLVTAGLDGRLLLWHTAAGEQTLEIEMFTERFWCVAVNRDGKWLVVSDALGDVNV